MCKSWEHKDGNFISPQSVDFAFLCLPLQKIDCGSSIKTSFHCSHFALSLQKIGCGSAIKTSFHCSHLALSLHKIGGGSAIKTSFHCSHLALSLHKIGGGSLFQSSCIGRVGESASQRVIIKILIQKERNQKQYEIKHFIKNNAFRRRSGGFWRMPM